MPVEADSKIDEDFLWVICSPETEKMGDCLSYGVTIPAHIKAGKRATETYTSVVDEDILGRQCVLTEEEWASFYDARKENPDISIDDWLTFLVPSDHQKTAFIESFNANPIQFSAHETSLLRSLMAEIPGLWPACEIVTALHWGDPGQKLYRELMPHIGPAFRELDADLPLPMPGTLILKCGEVKGMAVERVQGHQKTLRVVTLGWAEFIQGDEEIVITPYTLFEVDERLFWPLSKQGSGADVASVFWDIADVRFFNKQCNETQLELPFCGL